jgi:hypothetical protein
LLPVSLNQLLAATFTSLMNYSSIFHSIIAGHVKRLDALGINYQQLETPV